MDYEGAKRNIISRLNNELNPNLYYHGVHHTLDVLQSTVHLIKSEVIQGEEIELLKTAALFHDSGFLEAYDDHEETGIRIMKKTLPRFDYSEDQMKTITEIIRSTKISYKPKDRLQQIIRDADYDYLGREDFHDIARTLYDELHEYGFKYSEEVWDEIQVVFLERHQYHTKSSIDLRGSQKQRNLGEVRKRILAWK